MKTQWGSVAAWVLNVLIILDSVAYYLIERRHWQEKKRAQKDKEKTENS